VFQAVHLNDADPKVLAYQYLQTLPQLAQAQGNTFWVIPSEVTTALKTLSGAFSSQSTSPPIPQAGAGTVIAAALPGDATPQRAPGANGETGKHAATREAGYVAPPPGPVPGTS